MEWLIIIGIMFTAMSPVMWLKPTRGQRRHSRLRRMALDKGVNIVSREAPLHLTKERMPAYRLGYPGDQPGPDFMLVRDAVASVALDRFIPGWRFRVAPLRPLPDAARQRLEELATGLPDDALVVQSSEVALTLWWWESGTAEGFAPCIETAEALRDSLKGHADRPGAGPLAVPGSR